jgi:DNA-binding response OmpR family regulator
MDAKTQNTLLIVDDEAEIREIIQMHVAPLGLWAIEAGDGKEALDVVRQHHVDVIISDLMMPRVTGLALLSELRSSGLMQPFIFLTAYPSQDSTLQALRLGAFDYLEKPFEGDELRALISEAMRVSLEMQKLGVQPATNEIRKLRTLRFAEGQDEAATAAGSQKKLQEMLIAEATPQLLFCEAAIKGLANPDERTFELGYLFRVMQGIAVASDSIGAKHVTELARAAERYYTSLRVRPRAVTEAAIKLAQTANTALMQAVSTVGDANANDHADTLDTLARASEELEGAPTLSNKAS